MPGQTTKVPLSTDVGSGPEDDQQILFFGHFEEASDVQEWREVIVAIAEVEDVHLGLVKIPGNVANDSEMSANQVTSLSPLNFKISISCHLNG